MDPQTTGKQVPAASPVDLMAVVEAINALSVNTDPGKQETMLEAGCCYSCSVCGWWCWSCESCESCEYCYTCS
jgi:hypothetical protein